MSNELDLVLNDLASERPGNGRKPTVRDGRRESSFWAQHVVNRDDDLAKKTLEVKLDLHHTPLTSWRYQHTAEVVERLLGKADYNTGFLHRAGRALSQIEREFPAVVQRFGSERRGNCCLQANNEKGTIHIRKIHAWHPRARRNGTTQHRSETALLKGGLPRRICAATGIWSDFHGSDQ
jgi:hypothetical protein